MREKEAEIPKSYLLIPQLCTLYPKSEIPNPK